MGFDPDGRREMLGVTQARLNDLVRSRVGKFSLDALVALRRPRGAFGNTLAV
jgi:predicted XRE-type DNA-binding protein